MGENARPELDPATHFTTPEEIYGYLALKHANGLSFADVLDLHTQILTRIGRDYVKTWGHKGDVADEELRLTYQHLKDGGYYALAHLDFDDEWYWEEPRDEL